MRNNIDIDTEVFFYNKEYGFFSDKVIRIEGTKAIFNNWPIHVHSSGTKTKLYNEYTVSIDGLLKNVNGEKRIKLQYVNSHRIQLHYGEGNAPLNLSYDANQIAYASLDKTSIIKIALKEIGYSKGHTMLDYNETRDKFNAIVERMGKLENQESELQQLLSLCEK